MFDYSIIRLFIQPLLKYALISMRDASRFGEREVENHRKVERSGTGDRKVGPAQASARYYTHPTNAIIKKHVRASAALSGPRVVTASFEK